jgi:hypothetical protein
MRDVENVVCLESAVHDARIMVWRGPVEHFLGVFLVSAKTVGAENESSPPVHVGTVDVYKGSSQGEDVADLGEGLVDRVDLFPLLSEVYAYLVNRSTALKEKHQ